MLLGKRRKDYFKGTEKEKKRGKDFCKNREQLLSGIVGMIICIGMIFFSMRGTVLAEQRLIQQGIADKIIRFHVLANSDSKMDQRVKYEVRDVVMGWLQEETEAGRQMDEALLQEITDQANRVLQRENASYGAYTEIADCYFTERTYGKYTFPAGWYKALRIRLGEAKGQNWWCVLYPQLYLGDCIRAVEEKQDGESVDLKKILTVEEYACLLKEPIRWKIAFRWF